MFVFRYIQSLLAAIILSLHWTILQGMKATQEVALEDERTAGTVATDDSTDEGPLLIPSLMKVSPLVIGCFIPTRCYGPQMVVGGFGGSSTTSS